LVDWVLGIGGLCSVIGYRVSEPDECAATLMLSATSKTDVSCGQGLFRRV
jgi:hypothetical protein